MFFFFSLNWTEKKKFLLSNSCSLKPSWDTYNKAVWRKMVSLWGWNPWTDVCWICKDEIQFPCGAVFFSIHISPEDKSFALERSLLSMRYSRWYSSKLHLLPGILRGRDNRSDNKKAKDFFSNMSENDDYYTIEKPMEPTGRVVFSYVNTRGWMVIQHVLQILAGLSLHLQFQPPDQSPSHSSVIQQNLEISH